MKKSVVQVWCCLSCWCDGLMVVVCVVCGVSDEPGGAWLMTGRWVLGYFVVARGPPWSLLVPPGPGPLIISAWEAELTAGLELPPTPRDVFIGLFNSRRPQDNPSRNLIPSLATLAIFSWHCVHSLQFSHPMALKPHHMFLLIGQRYIIRCRAAIVLDSLDFSVCRCLEFDTRDNSRTKSGRK